MSFVLALLSVDVVDFFFVVALAEERLVSVFVFDLFVSSLLQLPLSSLLKLICQGHRQVLLPELELRLQLVIIRELGKE